MDEAAAITTVLSTELKRLSTDLDRSASVLQVKAQEDGLPDPIKLVQRLHQIETQLGSLSEKASTVQDRRNELMKELAELLLTNSTRIKEIKKSRFCCSTDLDDVTYNNNSSSTTAKEWEKSIADMKGLCEMIMSDESE